MCPPGVQNDSQKWLFHASGRQFPCFSICWPKCDFEQHSHGLACFYRFHVSLFRCRGCPESNKTQSCFRGVSGARFLNVFSEKYSKRGLGKSTLFHFFDALFCHFAADPSFYALFVKVGPKTPKRTSEWLSFWTLVAKVTPKTAKRTSKWTHGASKMTPSGTMFCLLLP